MRHGYLGVAALCIALAASSSAVTAADYFADSIYDSPMFNFEGFYAGIEGGGAIVPSVGMVGVVGIVAGTNFNFTESILGGLEFQGDTLWNGSSFQGWNALLLAKVGGFVTQDLMVYGTLGGGIVDDAGAYAFGAGLEYPLYDSLSVRGEVLGTGTFGGMPNGAKATAGLLFHLN